METIRRASERYRGIGTKCSFFVGCLYSDKEYNRRGADRSSSRFPGSEELFANRTKGWIPFNSISRGPQHHSTVLSCVSSTRGVEPNGAKSDH